MRLLHTSDWHIGKKLYEKSYEQTHQLFFDFLTGLIEKEKVDVLLVAGDIFNTPYPPQNALEQYYSALYKLSKSGLKKIIITGGNHDSPATLNAPKDLLKVMNIEVVGGVPKDLRNLIFELTDDDGKLKAVVAAVPFLREKDVRVLSRSETYKEHLLAVGKGIEEFYIKIAELTSEYKDKGVPVIAMGHLFVNDIADMTDEERDYYVGGLQQISYKQLPQSIDYYALGHIHKFRKVSSEPLVYYCGSPLKLSFNEVANKNKVLLLDVDEKIDVKPVEVPDFRILKRFEGTIEEVRDKISQFRNNKGLTAWIETVFCEEKRQLDMEKIVEQMQAQLADAELINFSFRFEGAENEILQKMTETADLKDLKPVDVFDLIISDLPDDEQEEMRLTFRELLMNM